MHKEQPPLGAKICSDICSRTLSVSRSEQSSDSEAQELVRQSQIVQSAIDSSDTVVP